MGKNIIFYFTGIGNSLKAARDISNQLDECEVVLVSNYKKKKIPAGYDRVGFVFPIYVGAPPLYFQKFLKETNFSNNKDAYFFTVATYGGT